jgi:hypothetical protein
VWAYDEATGRASHRHLRELRDRLAPPLPWIVEAALGVLIALVFSARRGPRSTAFATLAFAAATLFATPLATAWYAGLVPLPMVSSSR